MRQRMNRQYTIVLALLTALGLCTTATAEEVMIYDIVISGGRVMDPETMFDAVRNVGVRNGRPVPLLSRGI